MSKTEEDSAVNSGVDDGPNFEGDRKQPNKKRSTIMIKRDLETKNVKGSGGPRRKISGGAGGKFRF